MIALVPQHAEKIAPPRTLAVPYPLGRPFGVPGDAAFQHRILDHALSLLSRTDGPVFVTHAEDAPAIAGTEDAWVCPVNFADASNDNSIASQVHEEMALLRPWHDQGLADTVPRGLSGLTATEAVDFVAGFVPVNDDEATPEVDRATAEQLKHAVEDIKTFYNRAAVNQPGSIDVQALEDWYWGETQAGRLVRDVRLALLDHPDKVVAITAGLLLVPGAQTWRDEPAAEAGA
ncbi:MAG: hypothetical protein RJQ07_03660 [Pseudomonadales bacterium]